MQNDTYGEITREELADLRLHAQRCLECGMLATVDPAFHATRYAHAPRVRHGRGIIFQWDGKRHEWIQEANAG
jgi:ferredoxin-like protein FixX